MPRHLFYCFVCIKMQLKSNKSWIRKWFFLQFDFALVVPFSSFKSNHFVCLPSLDSQFVIIYTFCCPTVDVDVDYHHPIYFYSFSFSYEFLFNKIKKNTNKLVPKRSMPRTKMRTNRKVQQRRHHCVSVPLPSWKFWILTSIGTFTWSHAGWFIFLRFKLFMCAVLFFPFSYEKKFSTNFFSFFCCGVS